MELYKNKEQFIDLITVVAKSLKINESLIEKDYYVIYILSELNKAIPGLLFKGGTCCSHAYNAIDRFSEDIDLSLDKEHFGRNKNIEANHKIIETCDKLGFKIINRAEVEKHSHGNLNRYYIEYPISFSNTSIKPYVLVEMSFYQKSYPNEIKQVNSIVGEWLINHGNIEEAEMFNLTPFNICVQTLERTFIDKVFAICDYYERKEVNRNSRHIYDLYKINQMINLKDSSLKTLINEVREDRKRSDRSISAKDGFNINECLIKIVNSNFFKKDYEEITSKLLTKYVDYETSIIVLKDISELNIF